MRTPRNALLSRDQARSTQGFEIGERAMGQSSVVEWRAEPHGALGLLRMPAANGMHINTNGRRASGLENRVPAFVSKDHCRATWKNRETRQSLRHRRCGSQCPLVQ